MKIKVIILTIALSALCACSLIFGSPTATVKAFMAAGKKGDSEAMTKLFSSKTRTAEGEDKVSGNNKQFADMIQKANAATGPYNMNQITETKTGDTARVSFFYQNEPRTDSIKFVVDLSKEGGAWKIDDFGGADKEGATSDQPSPTSSIEVPPPPPSPLNGSEKNPPKTISGGVLNGKAVSLPKPPYPSVAKAVKASGTVTVQVTVDEKGNVTSASVVSGHPLLHASARAAAYQAKFSPTLLSGKPVRVTGVILYNFTPE